jgi:NRE family putative nickel resistance protein-like MFS transporter
VGEAVVAPITGRLAVFGPLRRPRFRRMVTAQFVSELGDGITTVALPLYVYARTQSPLATSLTFMAELLAGVVLGIVGGFLADALDRQRVLVASYVARAGLLVATVAVGPLPLVILFGVLARAGGQLDNPSFDAMVPEHAQNDLQQVLALRRFIQAVSYTIGPAIGALAVTVAGPRRALLLDTATFLVAVALLAPINHLDASVDERRAAHEGQSLVARASSMLDGVRILFATRMVARLIVYWSIVMATVAIVMAAAIVWFAEDLGVSDAWYGLSIAAYGSGATLGLVWAGGRTFRLSLATILVISAPVYALCSALGVVATVPWLLPLGWLLWGFAMGPEMVLGEVLVVESVPEALRGRAFAAMAVLTMVGMAVGYGVAGPMIETIGARATIFWTSVVILSLGLLWIGPAWREPRAGGSARTPAAHQWPARSAPA